MDYHALNAEQALSHLGSRRQGLANQEALKRLRKFGPNELSHQDRWRWLKQLIEPFKSAFVLVLIAGAVISSLTGHHTDTIVILAVVGINAVIEWTQSFSAARILSSLKRYAAKQVKVRRDQRIVTVDSVRLVPGDIVVVGQGEKIPADGRLLEVTDLSVDESSLTGESLPVDKHVDKLKVGLPLYQQHNMVFNGSVVLTGRAELCVTATGNGTQLGKIARLATQEDTKAPIYVKIKKLTLQLIVATVVIGATVMALGLIRGYNLAEMLRFAVALTVSVIPEGLPVTLTIILLLGLKWMAKNQAFVRNLPAVETLGMVTAIATDKTGTLTKSSLGISEVWGVDGSLSKAGHADFWLSVSHRHPDLQHPIERVITEYTESQGEVAGWQEVDDAPFDTKRRYTIVLWKKGHSFWIYVKGAPEDILQLSKLSSSGRTRVTAKLNEMTEQGMRVIAVAKKQLAARPSSLVKTPLNGFSFEGLIGFADELRPEAKTAIADTKAAGIDVFMLTGDHLNTARTISQQIGLATQDSQIVEGTALETTSDSKLKNLLAKVRVFARVLPEHKYRLLEHLRQTEITAMTGDGVNDAPALAQADVGIAMGSGTDAAKEAADMVLLDDNYSTIVKAIASGRTIYANIRKMVFYLLSTNLAEAITIIIGLLLGLPLPVTAVQVLWINLVTDTLMVVPLGIEPAEFDQMRRPPRKPNESLLSNHLVSRLIVVALVMAGISIMVFKYFLPQGIDVAQTMTFLSLVVVQWTNAFNIRSEVRTVWQGFKRPNWLLLGGLVAGASMMAVVIYGPLRPYLGTAVIPAHYYLYLLPSVLLTLAASELHKYWLRRRTVK